MDFRDREWLETNGLGGFACGTAAGVNTRRYHALLTAALRPPGDRVVLLSKLEETLVAGGQRFELGENDYPGSVHPRGGQFLVSFTHQPWPEWIYEAGGVRLTKRVYLVQGEDTVIAEYECSSPDARLEVRPLVAFRDYHSLTRENAGFQRGVETGDHLVRLRPYQHLPELLLAHNGEARASGHWYHNFEYAHERERGLDFQEDLFQPAVLEFGLDRTAVVMTSTHRRAVSDREALRAAEGERRQSLKGPLDRAARQFLAQRGRGWTVIAGYPWFTDWGRDTMIALPGLMTATGRHAIARDILAGFARHTDRGMLPNWFPEGGRAPEYNTIDAALWFFEATRAYLAATDDRAFVRDEIYPVLRGIVRWHLRGTRYGIGVDDDGLVRGGEPGVQLTWMDAKVGDWVVTPRLGKPVEIQALWYNALRILEDLAGLFHDPVTRLRCAELADWTARHFEPLFWNGEAACLYDVVDGEVKDAAIRPNQILAVSLPHALLRGGRAKQVVEAVERHLLTPHGLRSLAPSDPAYRGAYGGGVRERDSAYHQGTVWPWLLGPFLEAYLHVHERSDEARKRAAAWLQPLEQLLEDTGLSPEIAAGDAPHAPCGCFAQAWTVAALAQARAALA